MLLSNYWPLGVSSVFSSSCASSFLASLFSLGKMNLFVYFPALLRAFLFAPAEVLESDLDEFLDCLDLLGWFDYLKSPASFLESIAKPSYSLPSLSPCFDILLENLFS